MTKKAFLFIQVAVFVILSICIMSCSEDNNEDDIYIEDFVYPLEIGNKWDYHYNYSYIITKSDGIIDSILCEGVVEIEIIGTQILYDSISTYISKEYTNGTWYGGIGSEIDTIYVDEYEYNKFIRNELDGLFQYASVFNGIDISIKHKIYPTNVYFNSIREDLLYTIKEETRNDTTYFDPPRQSLNYPLYVGLEWIFAQDEHFEISNKNKVTGKETIEVPAGSFDCYQIQYLIDLDGDGNWDDDLTHFNYVCEKGIIKETWISENQLILDENGHYFGTAYSNYDLQLINIDLIEE